MSHTPTPWVAVTDTNTDPHTALVVTNAADKDRAMAIDCDRSGDDAEQDIANARLIAAAPDLLEACKMLDASCVLGGGVDLTKVSDAYMLARAAIRKAEGK
jgi:hypothetical protein